MLLNSLHKREDFLPKNVTKWPTRNKSPQSTNKTLTTVPILYLATKVNIIVKLVKPLPATENHWASLLCWFLTMMNLDDFIIYPSLPCILYSAVHYHCYWQDVGILIQSFNLVLNFTSCSNNVGHSLWLGRRQWYDNKFWYKFSYETVLYADFKSKTENELASCCN